MASLGPSLAPSGDLPSSPPTSSLSSLPTELIDALLDTLPASDLQRTSSALMRAYPSLPISKAHLYRHLVIGRQREDDESEDVALKRMWLDLQADKDENESGMIGVVRSFTMESWRGDADIMNNILRLIPGVKVLMINMGTNFAPEHLTEFAYKPRPALRRLELRFKPYVDKASYYQFLKGSYFDTAIDTMIKRWEASPAFTHLSLIQEIPPRFSVPHLVKDAERKKRAIARMQRAEEGGSESSSDEADMPDLGDIPDNLMADTAPVEPRGYTGHGPFPYLSERLQYTRPSTFAQPIVFFDIRCLYRFAVSDAARHLTHLRIRVPCRDICQVLSEMPPGQESVRPLPALRYLDLSTTNVRLEGWLPTLLRRYGGLQHLVLDRTNLFGFMGKDKGAELCADLGKIIVMAGLHRGKDKERDFAAVDLTARRQAALRALEARRRAPSVPERHGDSSGSEGEAPHQPASVEPLEQPRAHRQVGQSRRGHRSMAMASFSIRDRPNRRGAAARSRDPELVIPPPDEIAYVLPALPTMATMSIGGEAPGIDVEKARQWEIQFQRGWRDGLEKLAEWGATVESRYHRARKAADQWEQHEELERARRRQPQKAGKAAAAPAARVKPPTIVKLYQFADAADGSDELELVEETDRWMEQVKKSMQDIDYYTECLKNRVAPSSDSILSVCRLCTNGDDCEGPMRRGDSGERSDGRSVSLVPHTAGCGHSIGRSIWGRAEE